jgi:branched-chain amino acid transport system substrate-binding protein
VEDTGLDPEIALQKIKKLHEAGVRIVVGPASSAEIARVKDWADQNNMVILGYASTAPSLSIAGDNVFRMVPDDSRQGEAMAAYLNKSRTRVIIPVVRNDIWGTNLLSATKTRFERTGGIVSEPYLYEPGTRDFTKVVPNLSARITAA